MRSPGDVGGMGQEKGSRDRCSSGTALHAECTSVLSSRKKKKLWVTDSRMLCSLSR